MLDLRYKTIFMVALPLMGASFIQSLVLITDAAFLSRHSTVAFDASGNAGLIYITLPYLLHYKELGMDLKLFKRDVSEQKSWMNWALFWALQYGRI